MLHPRGPICGVGARVLGGGPTCRGEGGRLGDELLFMGQKGAPASTRIFDTFGLNLVLCSDRPAQSAHSWALPATEPVQKSDDERPLQGTGQATAHPRQLLRRNDGHESKAPPGLKACAPAPESAHKEVRSALPQ